MKQQVNGLIAITNSEDNSFELLDLSLNTLATLPGVESEGMSASLSKYLNFSTLGHDADIYFWKKGGNSFGIVDLANKQYDIIEGINGIHPKDESISVCGLSTLNGRRVVTVSCKKRNGSFYFNYWEKVKNSTVFSKPVEIIDRDSRRG